MNQEQALYKISDVAKLSGEFLLKALFYMVTDAADGVTNLLPKKGVGSEQHYYKFMATEGSKMVETFKASELHVTTLKSYLEQFGVTFAMKEQENGQKLLVFEAKDKALVAEAFSQTLDKLTNDKGAKELVDELAVKPRPMNLEERIQYLEAEEARAIAMDKALGEELNVIKEKSL